MGGAGDECVSPPDSSAEAHRLRRRDIQRRRLEREVFDSATRNLNRPLLRPRTGTPLRSDEHPDPHRPTVSTAGRLNGGPLVLPPVTFTEQELDEDF